MSPIHEDENTTRDKLFELRKWNRCKVCGGMLNVFLDADTHQAYLACQADQSHEGIVREASPYEKEGLGSLNIPTRRKIMVNELGTEKTKALEKYAGVVSLTKWQAREILQAVYPDAPEAEMARAILLCASYQLNPLMKHVFLIKFNKWNKEHTKIIGEEWATVVGIKAKRLLASRPDRRGQARPYSYADNTPRVMTEDEQKAIFGKSYDDRLYVITKGRDPTTGAEAVGYGFWLHADKVYGTEKGNSEFNMASIRSESQMLDRLRPGEMPVGIEVMPEDVAEAASKEGVIEGEFREVVEAKPKATKKPKAEVAVAEGEPEPELGGLPDESKESEPEPTPNTVEALKETMQVCNWAPMDVGKFCNDEKKWGIVHYEDLKPEQITELIKHIKQNPK